MQLTENFTLEELTHSSVAQTHKIDNTPTPEHIANLQSLCKDILQPIRNAWKKPIAVTSGFRCKQVNDIVKGSKTSQHLNGEAVDIVTCNYSNDKLFEKIKKMIEQGEITVGQLIWEKDLQNKPLWIHISLPTKNKKNEILYLK